MASAEDLGWAVGPLIAGILTGIIGPGWTISVGGILILATWIATMAMLWHPSAIHLHHTKANSTKPHRRRYKD